MPTTRKDGVPLEERTDGGQLPPWRLHPADMLQFLDEGIRPVEVSEDDFDDLERHGEDLEKFFGWSYDTNGGSHA